ncbi:FtsW/RodA/SpoVE family cell cycle protein [Demequina sp. NBRC 110053]|uniref:FtsW/RodA/SpoVE family cell cycle protein n=1 Tax=Demequina sp. NBRC 110053 TaxID=1570342 RepID=UPI000A040330|nr:putative peptidoglycan glycosyltransferase FtsW [Demequina sp. NBRC 110053]
MTATAPRRSAAPRRPAAVSDGRGAASSRAKASTSPPSGSPVLTYYLLAAATALLVVVGLAVVLSSSSSNALAKSAGNPYSDFLPQVAALGVGVVALVFGSRVPIGLWKKIAFPALLVSIVLLLAVAAVGQTVGGNKNWIPVGPATFQPSELAKLALALFLGVALAVGRKQLTTLRGALVPGGIAAIAVLGLVLYGRDMGTALVICLMVAAAYWVAGLPVRWFAAAGAVGIVGVLVLLQQGVTRTGRINVWLNPETCDPQGACMQTLHGTWALASGGLWGLGPGMSREKWGYLPVADSDFIFSIIGEEYGLVGTLLMLVAFGMMIVAVNRLVTRHEDPFVQISAAAIGAWIVGQACINIAVVVGFAPVTGVPLPLVSSGGSSLMVSLAAIGVLMAFARREPGAQEAFAARPSVIKRSFAVVARGRRG